MTTQEKIDVLYKELEKTGSKKRARDLKKAIRIARQQKRKEAEGGTIII